MNQCVGNLPFDGPIEPLQNSLGVSSLCTGVDKGAQGTFVTLTGGGFEVGYCLLVELSPLSTIRALAGSGR